MPLAAPAASGVPGMRLLRRPAGRHRTRLLRGGAVATVAVDALGADLGPHEVAAGVRTAASAGTRCIVFGPAARAEPRARRRGRGRRRAGRDLQLRGPGRAPCARSPTPRSCRRHARSPRAAPTRSSARGRPARRSPRGCSRSSACAASTGPGLAVLLPVPGRPTLLLDVGATVEVRPEQLVQFAFMGAAFMEGVMGVRAAARRPAERRRGAGEGHARRRRGARPPGRARRRAVRFRRQRRGRRAGLGPGRRGRHRRFHGQRRAEADGGHDAHGGRRDPRRDPLRHDCRSWAGC